MRLTSAAAALLPALLARAAPADNSTATIYDGFFLRVEVQGGSSRDIDPPVGGQFLGYQRVSQGVYAAVVSRTQMSFYVNGTGPGGEDEDQGTITADVGPVYPIHLTLPPAPEQQKQEQGYGYPTAAAGLGSNSSSTSTSTGAGAAEGGGHVAFDVNRPTLGLNVRPYLAAPGAGTFTVCREPVARLGAVAALRYTRGGQRAPSGPHCAEVRLEAMCTTLPPLDPGASWSRDQALHTPWCVRNWQ